MLFPFFWMLLSSFKDATQIFQMKVFPARPTLDNYAYIFFSRNSKFPQWFLNSAIVAVCTTVSVLFFDSLVGYTLSKLPLPGQEVHLSPHHQHAHDPDGDARHSLVRDGEVPEMGEHLLGHHVPRHDQRVRCLPHAAVHGHHTPRPHRRRARRREGRAEHLPHGGHAPRNARARHPRDLQFHRELERVPVAADRRVEAEDVHPPGGACQLLRRGRQRLALHHDRGHRLDDAARRSCSSCSRNRSSAASP